MSSIKGNIKCSGLIVSGIDVLPKLSSIDSLLAGTSSNLTLTSDLIVNGKSVDTHISNTVIHAPLQDATTSTGVVWSGQKITDSIAGLINDTTASATTTYSSNKINLGVTSLIDDTSVSLTKAYSSTKVGTEILGIINDTAASATKTYSSNKILSEITGVIDDNAILTSTTKTYSVNKINTDHAGFTNSTNALATAVAANTANIATTNTALTATNALVSTNTANITLNRNDIVTLQAGNITASYTTAQRDALVGVSNGRLIYNSTTKRTQIYENGVWSDTTNKVIAGSTNSTDSISANLITTSGINLNIGSTVSGLASVFEGSFFKGNLPDGDREASLVNQNNVGLAVRSGPAGHFRLTGSDYANKIGQVLSFADATGRLQPISIGGQGSSSHTYLDCKWKQSAAEINVSVYAHKFDDVVSLHFPAFTVPTIATTTPIASYVVTAPGLIPLGANTQQAIVNVLTTPSGVLVQWIVSGGLWYLKISNPSGAPWSTSTVVEPFSMVYRTLDNGILTAVPWGTAYIPVPILEAFFDASALPLGTLSSWNSTQANYTMTNASNTTVITGPKNLNCVSFAQDAYIYGANLWLWDNFSVHMVVQLSTVAGSSTFWNSGNYSLTDSLVAWSLNASNYVHESAGHVPLGINIANQWMVMTWIKQTNSPHLVCYRDGVQIGSNDFFANPLPTIIGYFGIGSNPGTNVGGSPLQVGEVRLYHKTQTPAEITNDVNALVTKWVAPNIITPILTSNTSDANFLVNQSSYWEFNTLPTYLVWNSFAGLNSGTYWASARDTYNTGTGLPQSGNSFNPGTGAILGEWFKITLSALKTFNYYRLSKTGNTGQQPTDFTLYGSTDDITYTTIDSQIGFTNYPAPFTWTPSFILGQQTYQYIVFLITKVAPDSSGTVAVESFELG